MFKNKIDERERQELYKIEHKIYWVMFALLIVEIFVQQVIMGAPYEQYAGELIALMVLCVLSCIMEMRGGHYDYFTKPGPKSYALYALITAVICTAWVVGFIVKSGRAEVLVCVIGGGICAVVVFGFTYVLLAIVGKEIMKRRAKLEAELEDDEDEEDEE